MIRRVAQTLGLLNSRNLFWAKYEPPNFGDWIGPYLFRKLSGRRPYFCNPGRSPLKHVFLTVGSILRHAREGTTVWGSGIISGRDEIGSGAITAVRGPRSFQRCRELGIPCPEIFGDPAILLPWVYRNKPTSVRLRLGIIPHYTDFEDVISRGWFEDDVCMIDVTRPVEDVVNAIAVCSAVVSSSLHGLIVAHAYGIPAGWVEFSDRLVGDGVKFRDYLECDGKVVRVEPLNLRKRSVVLQDLVEYSESAHFPDHNLLRSSLLEACPFADNQIHVPGTAGHPVAPSRDDPG